MAEIGIVIRTYNEEEFLSRMLDAIMMQSEQSFEIVVVDSGSTDKTVKIARQYDKVNIIEMPKKEFTYGRALNIGIAAIADYVDYIVMLSAHAIPCNKRWLTEIVGPMRQDSQTVGVYGKQIPLPEHLSNPIVRALSTEAYPNCYGEKEFITNSSYFFSNANSAISSESWHRRNFDEALDFDEDQDWARVTIAAGGWIAYQPTAAVFHSHADTFHSYFVRSYREVKAARKFDPLSNPIIASRGFMRNLCKFSFIYLRDSLSRRSLFGLPWDQFRTRTIRALATFKGRKDATLG